MAKSTLPKNDPPEAVRPTVELSEARAAAINELLATGYTDEAGKRREIRNREHAEFLARSGTIPPLPA